MYQGNIQPDLSTLIDLKAEHLKTLSAPLDAYWEEALIGFADHYEIQVEGAKAGFYALNGENQLVAFYLTQNYARHGEKAFAQVLRDHKVSVALAGTHDSYFFSLSLEKAARSQVHTLLFQDGERDPDVFKESDLWSFLPATEDDFDEVFNHYRASSGSMDTESIETGFEGLKGYIRSVMDQHRIFLLREEDQLIATSECRISRTQAPFADLGMIVAPAHRRKGVGSYILTRTKEFCYERQLRPICSCEAGNIGSKKAIARAGFVSWHRVFSIEIGD